MIGCRSNRSNLEKKDLSCRSLTAPNGLYLRNRYSNELILAFQNISSGEDLHADLCNLYDQQTQHGFCSGDLFDRYDEHGFEVAR